MNAALQQRLIGAIVLVALAVIFLPMLLDGSGARERFDVDMDIPERPQAPPSRIEDAPQPAAGGARDTQAQGAALARAGDAGATAAPESEPPAPAADDTTAATATPAGGDATGAGDGAQAGPGAWVVQVGSFARETNALVLRDRLREAGYEAFVEEGRGEERTLWRVRVGPVSERAQAEELRVALERERDGRSALVMSYP